MFSPRSWRWNRQLPQQSSLAIGSLIWPPGWRCRSRALAGDDLADAALVVDAQPHRDLGLRQKRLAEMQPPDCVPQLARDRVALRRASGPCWPVVQLGLQHAEPVL